jgi:hypothetical protein
LRTCRHHGIPRSPRDFACGLPLRSRPHDGSTSPMPPAPIRATISYGPNRDPAGSVTVWTPAGSVRPPERAVINDSRHGVPAPHWHVLCGARMPCALPRPLPVGAASSPRPRRHSEEGPADAGHDEESRLRTIPPAGSLVVASLLLGMTTHHDGSSPWCHSEGVFSTAAFRIARNCGPSHPCGLISSSKAGLPCTGSRYT